MREELVHLARRWLNCIFEVLKRPDGRGFRVIHTKWICKRSIAWFIWYRRLGKDHEANMKQSENMILSFYLYKSTRKFLLGLKSVMDTISCIVLLKGNNVKYTCFNSSGRPYIMVARGGSFTIGANFSMNNGIQGNPIGCYDRCTFFVDRRAKLIIGDNVGISQAALICHKSIIIGNHVKIGGGAKIYDTDFHSLDPNIRSGKEDLKNKQKAPVIIKDNALIGAQSIILKGVTIGKNSIIGAGSVVTKSVPDNQIWAGNPAKFIRNL